MLRIHNGTGKGTDLMSRVQETEQMADGMRVAMEMDGGGEVEEDK